MLALRATVHVRDMHQRLGLFLDRADQMRMAVAERIDRDARSEIEEAAAVVGNQIDALASHRPHVAPRVDGHERRDGHRKGLLIPKAKGSPDGDRKSTRLNY